MSLSRRSFFKVLAGVAVGLAVAPIKTVRAWAAPASPLPIPNPGALAPGTIAPVPDKLLFMGAECVLDTALPPGELVMVPTTAWEVQAKAGAFKTALEKELDGLIADFDQCLEQTFIDLLNQPASKLVYHEQEFKRFAR